MGKILDHCPPGFILDPPRGSPPLTATEARRLMREALTELREDLSAEQVASVADAFRQSGLWE